MAAGAESYFEAAQRLYESGHESEARRALKQELRLRPDNLDARYDLAVLLNRAGHDAAAEDLYRENLDRGRHLPSAINLASLLAARGEREQARAVLERTARRHRFDALPWYTLAELAAEAGDTSEADRLFERAVRVDPLNGFAHIRHARFLSQRDRHERARRHAERAVELLPDCARCWRIAGDVRRRAGDDEAALAAYQRAAALEPARGTRLRIIDALESLGELERARRMREALPQSAP